MVNKKLLDELPDDGFDAVAKVHSTFGSLQQGPDYADQDEQSEVYIEFLSLAQVLREKYNLSDFPEPPDISHNSSANIQNIGIYFDKVSTWLKKESATKLYEDSLASHRLAIGAGFSYEFSDDETNRINELISELRELFAESSFEDEHKQRILKRLEKLQAEVHKKVSDLDRFWGMIGDAGVAMKKLGEDAKPIVDRIRELAEITWKAQSRAEGLPEPDSFPLLTSGDEGD